MHFDPDFFKVKTIFGKDSGYPDDLDCKSFLLDMMLAEGFISGDESEEEIDWALYVYMYLTGIIEPDFSQPETLDDDSAIPDDVFVLDKPFIAHAVPYSQDSST